MKIHDVSLTITSGMPVWPGDPQLSLERVEKIEEGANANVSRLEMSVHTGTHVDAPFHFIQGKPGVDAMPLDVMVGHAVVLQFPDSVHVISADELKNQEIPDGTRRLLLKTRNSGYWAKQVSGFQTDFVGINESGAEYLVDQGIRLIGIDYLSIAPYKNSRPTHQILLGAGLVVIEGLDLSPVEPGGYTLFCLPLKLGGADGAPARVILIES